MKIFYEVNSKTGKITWAASEYFEELIGKEYQLGQLEATEIAKTTDLSENAKLLLSAVAGAVIQHLLDQNISAATIFKTGKILFKGNKTKIVVLSGSLKFYNKMQELHEKLELEKGWVIIGVTPHVMQRDFTTSEEDLLDELHRAKIRLADAIFVVNVNGYIGKSTKAEINFAKQLNKEIIYLEN